METGRNACRILNAMIMSIIYNFTSKLDSLILMPCMFAPVAKAVAEVRCLGNPVAHHRTEHTHTHTHHIIEPFLVPRTKPFPSGIYCRASNTGNVGFVLVGCVLVHTHSTVWYSLHAAACNYLTTHPFSAFWCAPKNRQIDCVVTFFWDSRSTKHRKYMCLALRRSRTTVFTMFLFCFFW